MPTLDYANMPFSLYLQTALEQSPIPLWENDNEKSIFDARGFKGIGHFDEVYPEECENETFERYHVLENDKKERLVIFNGAYLTNTTTIICDPNDKEAFTAFIMEYHRQCAEQEEEIRQRFR